MKMWSLVVKDIQLLALSILCLSLLGVSPVDATTISGCTNGRISLSCSANSGCLLSIHNASFYHPLTVNSPPNQNCSTKTNRVDGAGEGDGHCKSNASMVWLACDGKRQCSFTVPQERPKGRCTTVSSYMEIEYKCTCLRCEVLTALPRRTVTYTTPYLTPGTVATYNCLGGYELAGPKTRKCLGMGKWADSEPVCSVPLSVCPSSSHPTRTFRSRCYEIVDRVATWESAREHCNKNNGTIVAPRSKAEIYFLTQEVEKLDIYGYLWLSKEEDLSVGVSSTRNGTTVAVPTGKQCREMYKPDPNKVTWLQRDTHCSYMNAFICAYEIDKEIVEKIDSENQTKRTRAGIAIGITIGIIILILGLFCIFCRDRKKNSEKGITIEDGHLPREHPMLTRESDNDIYDDTLPECDVTSASGVSPPVPGGVPHYAEVHKGNKRPADTHYNYDEVYTTMRAASDDGKLSRTNTYENISLHNIMGSLKKTLTRPWRLSGSHKISDNNGSTHSRPTDGSVSDKGAVIMRHKPMTAPKPAIRKSALEAKLEAIKNKKARSKQNMSSEDEDSSSPSLCSRSNNDVSILRDRSGANRRDPTNVDKIQSGIEIVENEIYDEEQHKCTELTEL